MKEDRELAEVGKMEKGDFFVANGNSVILNKGFDLVHGHFIFHRINHANLEIKEC